MMVVLTELSEGTSSSSNRNHKYEYDVFLSFRGIDTRLGFVAHLYNALKSVSLSTFYDDEEIDTGLTLKPKLENAIKASRASIIVLSHNYASSTWCLNELVMILEQRDHIVIPIFFHVEPTDVRKQQRSFGKAMAEHKQRMEAETDSEKRIQWAQNMELWKKALVDVANLKGKDAKGRKEPDFIEEIVAEIYHRLRLPLRTTLPHLIGREDSIEFITSWLTNKSSHTADILTISGMGGIGKTTLATYVYAMHHHEFHTSSIVNDIGRTCVNKLYGLLDLQKQLCSKILKTNLVNQVRDEFVYASMIENALAHAKVLLVLDDIDSPEQLNALLGKKGLHPGSKIIITTRDVSLTERCELFKALIKPKHTKQFLGGLYGHKARELFCHHASRCKSPKEGFEEVTKKLVEYCGGLPLALEVLGKSLHNRDVAYWEWCINRLKKEPDSSINKVLQISFDSLPINDDKELFKHIACFFVGTDRDHTEVILNACDINTKFGIMNLIERCLLSIDDDNILRMHQMLQEMGRDVVRQESPNKPWKRTRLWCNKETVEALKRKKVMENLLGLALDTRMLEKEDNMCGSVEFETDALSKMDSLMLLQLNYVHLIGSYNNFPQELRWLSMHGFPSKSISLDTPMKNLVSLDMSYSNIQSFDISYSYVQRLRKRLKNLIGSCSKDEPLFRSLKILNLSFCQQLYSISGFAELPALERLILKHCKSLFEISESIEQCGELVYVDLSYCNKLKKHRRNLGKFKKLETLVLDGCDLGEVIQTGMRDMDLLEMLRAKNMESIPNDLKSFASSLPSSLVRLSLKYNNMSSESFPADFSCMSMLKELDLDGNPLVYMPNCVRSLPKLGTLSMSNCEMLKSVEYPPCTLKELIATFYITDQDYNGESNNTWLGIQRIVFYPEMSPLILIAPSKVESPGVIEGMLKVEPMAGVDEKVLSSLGWSNLEWLKKRRLRAEDGGPRKRDSQIQMFYEFGIFSTIYEGEVMPEWIRERSKGPSTSMSFTMSSSPNTKLRGLNICYCFQIVDVGPVYLPRIKVSNITKKRTWKYEHYHEMFYANEGLKCFVYISHWMLGKNEMEGGDDITITMLGDRFYAIETSECGFSLVYDEDDDGKDEKEDVLGYYKSWNHIIGGDLRAFQESIRAFQEGTINRMALDAFLEDATNKTALCAFLEDTANRTALCAFLEDRTNRTTLYTFLEDTTYGDAMCAFLEDTTNDTTLRAFLEDTTNSTALRAFVEDTTNSVALRAFLKDTINTMEESYHLRNSRFHSGTGEPRHNRNNRLHMPLPDEPSISLRWFRALSQQNLLGHQPST